jgi:hypothetical protein
MADHEKAAPSPCKCRVRRRDYPQGKQRKETGLAGKWGAPAYLAEELPAGPSPGTPRQAGIRAKKKGLETSRALGVGAGGIEPERFSLRNKGPRKTPPRGCPQSCPQEFPCRGKTTVRSMFANAAARWPPASERADRTRNAAARRRSQRDTRREVPASQRAA